MPDPDIDGAYKVLAFLIDCSTATHAEFEMEDVFKMNISTNLLPMDSISLMPSRSSSPLVRLPTFRIRHGKAVSSPTSSSLFHYISTGYLSLR